MTALRVAVVGSGFIARTKHLPALANLGSTARLVAICDLDADQARELAERFGPVEVYTDVDAMLRAERPDVVDVCTPPTTHAALAISAIEAGAHVVIEKPMCQTVEECDDVMAVARRHGRKVCVAHSDLFYPGFRRLRRRVEAREIGDFRGMRIHLSTPIDYMTSRPDHWAHALPGGVFGESGPHVVYMTLPFINPIREVHVTGQKLLPDYPWSRYEDYRLDMVGDNGTCTATMTYATNEWAANVEVWGTDGTLRTDLESQALVLTRRPELNATAVGLGTLGDAAQTVASGIRAGIDLVSKRYTQTHQELMKAFFDSIIQDTASPVPASEGRECIRVMNLITDQLDHANA